MLVVVVVVVVEAGAGLDCRWVGLKGLVCLPVLIVVWNGALSWELRLWAVVEELVRKGLGLLVALQLSYWALIESLKRGSERGVVDAGLTESVEEGQSTGLVLSTLLLLTLVVGHSTG